MGTDLVVQVLVAPPHLRWHALCACSHSFETISEPIVRIPKRRSRKSVARPKYPKKLLSPLTDGETPESKLPILLAVLGAKTDREGIVALLKVQVIGHNVRDYPAELRGRPLKGPSAEARVPTLLQHYAVSSDREGLLALAIRHLRGFRPAVKAKVGRKSAVARRGFDRNTFEAEMVDEFYFRYEEARKKRKSLSKLQWAQAVCAAAANDPKDPLYGVKPKQVVQWLSEGARRERRLEKESNERARTLRAIAGLPPEE